MNPISEGCLIALTPWRHYSKRVGACLDSDQRKNFTTFYQGQNESKNHNYYQNYIPSLLFLGREKLTKIWI